MRRTTEQLLELCAPESSEQLAIRLDLRHGPLARRLTTARKDQPLGRALGLHRRASPPTVLDATAGFGRDALLLAHLGCRVLACERLPPLATMLDDACERGSYGARLTVCCGDAAAVLRDPQAHGLPAIDTVYLDPMFPEHGAAQVKKEMQACRLLAGPPQGTAELVHHAFRAAGERVVVKRAPHDLPLAGPPSFTVEGERVRFDVYLNDAAARAARAR